MGKRPNSAAEANRKGPVPERARTTGRPSELPLASFTRRGSEITPDQAEFGRAMEKYMRGHHRPFPTWSEVLEVIHGLGYRKKEVTSSEDHSI